MAMPTRVLAVAAFFIVALGAYMDSAHGGGTKAPVCDNKCRERLEHYFCPNGPCLKFMIANCILCISTNDRCVDRNDYNPLRPRCLSPLFGEQMTQVEHYPMCDLLCTCVEAGAVEAKNTSGDTTASFMAAIHVCRQ